MKLNSNKAFNLLGIVCMVVLIGALMLAGWAGLSMTGIIVTGVVVAAIGNFVAIILLTKYSSEQEEPADAFHPDEVRVPRTALSTGIEIITGVLVAMAWAVSAKNGIFTEADGSFSTLFSMLLFTCTIIFMLCDTYSPGDIHNAGILTNLKQVKWAVYMNRLFAVLFAACMLIFSFPAVRQQNWIVIGLVALLLLAYIALRILIRRARD